LAGGKGFFADYLYWHGGKGLPLLVGGKGFFADCLYWQVAKLLWYMRFQLCHLLSMWQVAKVE